MQIKLKIKELARLHFGYNFGYKSVTVFFEIVTLGFGKRRWLQGYNFFLAFFTDFQFCNQKWNL